MSEITVTQIKDTILTALDDHQAADVKVLPIKTLTDIADYLIIATANSTTHAKALARKSCAALTQIGIKPIGMEGEVAREWVLADFGDVILHIMLEETRKFYDLEQLWGENETAPTSPSITALQSEGLNA